VGDLARIACEAIRTHTYDELESVAIVGFTDSAKDALVAGMLSLSRHDFMDVGGDADDVGDAGSNDGDATDVDDDAMDEDDDDDSDGPGSDDDDEEMDGDEDEDAVSDDDGHIALATAEAIRRLPQLPNRNGPRHEPTAVRLAPGVAEAGIRLRLAPLDPAVIARVNSKINGSRLEDVVQEKFNLVVTVEHMKRLTPVTWLVDELMNMFMAVLQTRDARMVASEARQRPSHFFNSFFMTKLNDEGRGYSYKQVCRWMRKRNIFDMDKLFVPINIGDMHWCMAILFMQEKRIQYYDSIDGSYRTGRRYIELLLRYVSDEHMRVYGSPLEVGEWELWCSTRSTPTQENGSDCGVFSLMVADFASGDLALEFTQSNVDRYRLRIGGAILRGRLDG
jgi:sentrin-specific protease 1